jgi:general secretion pathway protein C
MMSLQTQGQWMSRLLTALLWSLAAASVVYWGLRIAGRGAVLAVPEARSLVVAEDAAARQAAVARLLGAQPPAADRVDTTPGAAQRFALLGVIASVTGKGAALISIDGEPAKPLTVGTQIVQGYVLESVTRREAVLVKRAQVPEQIILSLPALEATTATAQPSAQASVALPATPPAVMGAPQPTESPGTSAAPTSSTEPRPDSRPPARQDSRYRALPR